MSREQEGDLRALILKINHPPKFPLGQVVSTAGAALLLLNEQIGQALTRHVNGDWGELDEEDREANDAALKEGDRLLSAYTTPDGVDFWIITEADRSVTTVLLPEEY